MSGLDAKTVLLTGGTGSFGNKFTEIAGTAIETVTKLQQNLQNSHRNPAKTLI